MRRAHLAVFGALAALLATPTAAAGPAEPTRALASPADDARAIRTGLVRAVRAGRLSAAEARRYRLVVSRCRAVLTLLPGSRGHTLARVLHEVRLQARVYNRPRALALFSMLEENADYLSVRAVPPAETDVVGADGIVYRAGWDYGLQFHPLANFAALNAHVFVGRNEQAARLAAALVARSVPTRGGAVWEYYFPYGGGRPPWTSGMAQAVAAQALARAGTATGDASLVRAAARAFGSIRPRLVIQLSAGPWIRHYDFSGLVVLNAHLQAVASLEEYAALAGDAEAGAFAARMKGSAAAMLPRFDTGYWSHYSLGRESPLEYHRYVIRLLTRLAERTGEPVWSEAAARFQRYLHEPPVLKPGPPVLVLYPWPAEGFRDTATVRFWLSKISTVAVSIGGERRSLGLLRGGWHAFSWRPGRKAPGEYSPSAGAVDLAGNGGRTALQPIVVAVDREPPALTAKVVGRRLVWRARDAGTPWLRLSVRLERAGARRVLALGRRGLSGSLRLRIPRGRWNALLVASDSSGNRARAPLGLLPN